MNQQQIQKILSQLKPIEQPEPISMFNGFDLLFYVVIVLAILFIIFWFVKKLFIKKSVITIALAELDKIDDENSVYKLNHILKQVALVFYPQSKVANLSGKNWLNFLNSKKLIFDEYSLKSFDSLYSGQKLSSKDFISLKAKVKQWILLHKNLEKIK